MIAAKIFLQRLTPEPVVRRHASTHADVLAHQAEAWHEWQCRAGITVTEADVLEAAESLGLPIDGKYIAVVPQSVHDAFKRRA